ncbi:zinc transporter ZIP12-like isoform X3 [Asterias rubens]|uniref:zinc transporter ZIP12-like isoform X2 n=1 Tax=Asterias rubens TaxID=7604 RepID=UPI001455D234|nr:zinc transporter ZIP12-like isoform X2 [Asterias rubens]XP_033638693.1 zinc transporter ZIP12-like isoform X3 [Asterias rubens]
MRCSEHFDAAVCETCLNAEQLFSILNVNQQDGLDENNFQRACVVLMYYVTDLGTTCADVSLHSKTYEYFEHEIQQRTDGTLNITEDELEQMLDSVAVAYTAENYAKCFNVETIFDAAVADHVAGANDHEVEDVAAILISSLVRGFCIGNATEVDPDAFLEDIFETYSTDGIMSEEQFVAIYTIIVNAEEEHAHEAHARRRRNVDEHDHDHEHDHEHDHDHEEGHGHGVDSCFTIDELLETFGVNHSVGLTRQQFKEISPALIQQAVSDACAHEEHTDPRIAPNTGEVWGYSMLAVFIISLCAVAGVVFLPCLNSDVYLNVLQTMMALAVATLVGDAVIHLIPQAVGLHAHDFAATSGEHNHDAGSDELAFIWKCLVVVAAIYAFFLVESLMHMSGGGHSHSGESGGLERSRPPSMRLKEAVNGSFKKSPSVQQLELADVEDDVRTKTPKPTVCCGIGSLPFMILVGDGLHNFGDGLAIGAAFATSVGAGLSTSIAVLCHELPHELGDFAVLLNSGLTFRQALGFNFLSATMAFIGLCIGIPLAAGNAEARQWIFAVAAGMFLYVALVDMLPELIHHELKNKGTVFLLHNAGFLCGTVIILVIALYEDAINISI